MKDGLQKLCDLSPTNFGYRGRKIEISVVCSSQFDDSTIYQSDFNTVWCSSPGIKCDWWKEYILSLGSYIVDKYDGYVRLHHDLNEIIKSYIPIKAYIKVYGLLRYDENIIHEVNIKDDVKAEFMQAVSHYLKTYNKVIKFMSR